MNKKNIYTFFGYVIAAALFAVLLRDVVRLMIYSNRGLDITDEAFYALSYATRDQVGRSFTGATWIIGSIYDLLGQDLAKLRIAKILFLSAAGALLGDQSFKWICIYRQEKFNIIYTTKEKTGWRLTLIFGSVIAALFPYSWTPATPNYNDLNLIILLTIASLLICLIRRHSEKVNNIHIILFGLTGFLLGMECFVKSSSALAVFILVIPIYLAYFTSIRNLLKILSSSLAGFVLFWTLTYIFIADIFTVVPESLNLLKVIAKDGYDPKTLINGYINQVYVHTRFMVEHYWLLLFFCLFFPFMTKKIHKSFTILPIVGITAGIFHIYMNKTYLSGGPLAIVAKGQFFIISMLIIASVLIMGDFLTRIKRPKREKKIKGGPKNKRTVWIPNKLSSYPIILIIWILLLLPFAQALGTLNSIFTGATFSNISWVLLIVVFVTCLADLVFSRYSLLIIALFSIVGIRQMTVDGFINHPYRLLSSPTEHNSTVHGLTRINELKFDKRGARYLTQLREIRDKYGIKDGTTMLGLWDLPGEIYALGGISPGEPWYFKSSIRRTINDIKYACKMDQISSSKKPVILVSGTWTVEVSEALIKCGINFQKDYTIIGKARSPYTNLYTEFYIANEEM